VQRDTRWQGGLLEQADARLKSSGEHVVARVAQREVSGRDASPAEADGLADEDLEGQLLMSDHDAERRASGTDLTAQARMAQPDAASAARQDVPPFAEVFRTYSPFVWRVLLRLGVAEADIDDVAQEVFLGIHRNLPRFEGRCSLRTWVYGICHRRAVDYRRRASVRPELYSDDPPEQGVAASQETGLVLSQARAQLAAVLDGLDEEKRTVFVLFDIEGVPMDEVAEIVGCPLQTAYSRLYAARRKVEATLVRLRSDRRSL
jgi:RNA polymerase sigma-70 factor (ECF subfamily)